MSALYNEYLTGSDREIAILEAEYDARMAKLTVLFETVDASLKANMLAAEAKVFAESGTYDDLTMLYTEAEQEADEKKKGIIAKMFEAVANFFKGIGNWIKGLFKSDKDIPETTEVPEDAEENMNIFERWWNNVVTGFNKIKSGDIKGGCLLLLKAAIPTAIAGGIATATTMVIVKRDKLKAWIKSLTDKEETITSATTTASAAITAGTAVIDAVSGSTDSGDKEGGLKGVLNKALNAIKAIGNWIKKAILKIKSWCGAVVEKVKEKTQNFRPRKFKDPTKADKKDDTKDPDKEPKELKSPEAPEEPKATEAPESPKAPEVPLKIKLTPEEQKVAFAKKKKELRKPTLSKQEKKDALAEAISVKKKKASLEANNVTKGRTASGALDSWSEDEFNESVSLFGVELDEDDLMFIESEIANEEFDELCELFANL